MRLLFPEFLWGLLSLVIPLLIHLLQLRRPQRVQFTNTGFIEEIEFKTGRRRLQDWLILALRMAAIVALLLAFCQPFIPAHISSLAGDEQKVQIFADNSPSMQAPADGASTLESKAVAVAGTLGDSYKGNTQLESIGYSGKAAVANSSHSLAATSPLRNRVIGWGAPVVKQALEASGGGTLYLISDFQKNEATPTIFSRLSARRDVVLLPQVTKPTGNIYVDSVWLNDAFVRAKAGFKLHIRLRNGGREAVTDCPVKVYLGGKQVAALQATVTAGQASEQIVQLQLADERLETGQVVVADVPVTFDNTYYFALQPAGSIQVVELGPAPTARAAYQNEPLFRYNYSTAQQADFGKLQQANLVLVSEPEVLDAGLRAALVGVVQRGGSVVVVPSARPQAHQAYGQLLQALGVGGVQWEPSPGQPVLQELAMPDLRSPFFKDVFGAQPRQVALPEVSPVLRLAGGGTDILRLRDGVGFLTEFEQGPGRVYVFSAPFDKEYSSFTGHALFVPVLYRLAMLSYRNDQPLAYRIGQQVVRLRVAAKAPSSDEAEYRLVRDSVTIVPTQRIIGQQLQLQIPSELTKPGFYQLQRQGKFVATLAFNVAKKESELAAYSAAELRQLVGPNRPNVHVLDANEQPVALQNYRAAQTGRPLWRYCLLLALGCLLAEGIVLRWGRRAQAQWVVTS